METPIGPRTRARARKLATIFDDVGALNAATPSTPHLASGESEASTAAAVLLQRLRRDSFDVQCAKTAATKVLGDKTAKFKGSENSASDIFSQLVSELQQLFTLQSPAFAPLFELTAADAPVLSAANELLYAVVTDRKMTDPRSRDVGSPARNWVEASGSDVPADGKRATLEVVRMLADVSTPFDAFAELLEVRISDERDPDSDIRLFNSCLRDAQRLQALPEDAVKRQFISALSGPAYAALVDSFARADQRAAVSLLTLQARVREQYRCGRLSGKRTAGRPMSVASCATDTGLSSAIDRLSAQLVKLQRDVDSLKKGGSKPPHGKHTPRSFHRPGVQPLAHSASSEVAFDKRSGTFVPTCRHEKCRAVGSKHWLSECPHKDTRPMSISASYCQAVESYDSDVLALRFQRYYDAGDEGSMEHLCALVGQPEICELSAHSFAPEPTALQQFKDAAASAESAHLMSTFPLAVLHLLSRAAFVPPSASLALGPVTPADSSFKTFNAVHPDWFDIDPEPVEVCDSDDDGEGSYCPPGACLTEIEGGAPPAAAAFRRFGVPRGSRPFGIGAWLSPEPLTATIHYGLMKHYWIIFARLWLLLVRH
ncbi:hypothetical protein CYMTET_54041 [Cymbomonas tetramitiformis]|uniref:Uncharacterized protein n=1 Tax=Cymbomonas tetramitiformis TaxID=36881 RepID=A0AAE0EQ01_9CHLO|nr:hypothetical protein CYMTET_54041 [Cymbomonas tetramitiformis]